VNSQLQGTKVVPLPRPFATQSLADSSAAQGEVPLVPTTQPDVDRADDVDRRHNELRQLLGINLNAKQRQHIRQEHDERRRPSVRVIRVVKLRTL
jgi:hypothetical protein